MQPVSHLAVLVLLLVAAGEVVDSTKPATCTAEYEGYTKNLHTMCLNDHPSAVEVTLTQEEKDAVVNRHNEIRANVTPTAANMQKMIWDDNLAKVAAKWARQCKGGHDKNRSQPELNKYGLAVGQNAAAGHSSLVKAVNSWYKELPVWVFGTWTGGAGHYIQEIYHASSRIGCGQSKCNTKYGNHYVCNYYSGAYSDRDPYEQGAPCSKCPDSCDKSGKLCDCGAKHCTNRGTLDLNTCTCQCQSIWTGDECETLNCPKKQDFETWCSSTRFDPENKCPNATVNWYSRRCPIRCGICPDPTESIEPTETTETTQTTQTIETTETTPTTPTTLTTLTTQTTPTTETTETAEPCQGTVCQHNGVMDKDTCKCTCPPGISGDQCETCPTKDNARWCSYSTFYPKKVCPDGSKNWYTKKCPIRCGVCPEPCQDTVCQHNGQPDPDTCKCICPPGISGDQCETCPTKDNALWCSYPQFSPDNSCPNGSNNWYTKQCPIRCGVCPEPCQDTVCQHNGQPDPDTCKCICPPGFSGDQCETCPTEDNELWCDFKTFYPEKSCPNGTYTWHTKQCPIRCGVCPKV